MTPVPESTIFHIAAASVWEEARGNGVYAADSLSTEGFIHCSTSRQVIAVANRLFRGRTDLVLLQIDVASLAVPVRYENLEGGTELFPHVYGPLPLGAVVAAAPLEPDAGGRFHREQLAAVVHGSAQTHHDDR